MVIKKMVKIPEKVFKKKCGCKNTKIIADHRNDQRDPRGLVTKCLDCGKVSE